MRAEVTRASSATRCNLGWKLYMNIASALILLTSEKRGQ
jgi:hypothetical protein